MARVMIVDDSPEWRAVARIALVPAGHDIVGEAEDGAVALALYPSVTPDIVTLDVQMPVLNGLDCLAALRAQDPTARVVMVTGSASAGVRQRAQELGALGFVAKPYEPADLVLALREALL